MPLTFLYQTEGAKCFGVHFSQINSLCEHLLSMAGAVCSFPEVSMINSEVSIALVLFGLRAMFLWAQATWPARVITANFHIRWVGGSTGDRLIDSNDLETWLKKRIEFPFLVLSISHLCWGSLGFTSWAPFTNPTIYFRAAFLKKKLGHDTKVTHN